MKKESPIEKTVREIMEQRTKILDDFCRVYIGAHSEAIKNDPTFIENIELVEKRDKNGAVFFFRRKSLTQKQKRIT